MKKEVPGVEIVQIVPEDSPASKGSSLWRVPATSFPRSSIDPWWITRSPSPVWTPRACGALLARFGIFAGQSSGAYLYGVYQTAKRIRKGVIVTLLNDIGERYMSTGLWTEGAL